MCSRSSKKIQIQQRRRFHSAHVRQAQKGDGAVWSHTTCSPSVLTAAECDGRGTTEKGERGRINDSQIGKSRGHETKKLQIISALTS